MSTAPRIRRRRLFAATVVGAASVLAAAAAPAAQGSGAPCNNSVWCSVDIVRASVGDGYPGTEGKSESHNAAVSADGRYVAFAANDDFGSDGNTWFDVYVRDVVAHDTILVSRKVSGDGAGNEQSDRPTISYDGRFVAFDSVASDLTGPNDPGGIDTNGFKDIYLRDMAAGTTIRVSLSSANAQTDKSSGDAEISGNGGHVAFKSFATGLVEHDHNAEADIFVRDVKSGTTERISVGDQGQEANGESQYPSISGDGRYVAFESHANNLVPDDTNGVTDIFLRDRLLGTTVMVTDVNGGADGLSTGASISGDGRHVAFASVATNLVANDGNAKTDVFVRDMESGMFTRISENVDGKDASGLSSQPSIVADGSKVAFESDAADLVQPGADTNGSTDVFVRDVTTGKTTLESVSDQGTQGNHVSVAPKIAADGKHVAFDSLASDLVPNDSNMEHDVFLRWL